MRSWQDLLKSFKNNNFPNEPESVIVYHGSTQLVEFPEIRVARYHKDFYFGFYCTSIKEQAKRWASKYNRDGFINIYKYTPNKDLKVLKFDGMTEEWLDFIVECRLGRSHNYDIVEGPMADDTVFNFVQNFIDGKISRAAFWELVKFRYPTHQISFHTARALATLEFLEGEKVYGEEQ